MINKTTCSLQCDDDQKLIFCRYTGLPLGSEKVYKFHADIFEKANKSNNFRHNEYLCTDMTNIIKKCFNKRLENVTSINCEIIPNKINSLFDVKCLQKKHENSITNNYNCNNESIFGRMHNYYWIRGENLSIIISFYFIVLALIFFWALWIIKRRRSRSLHNDQIIYTVTVE